MFERTRGADHENTSAARVTLAVALLNHGRLDQVHDLLFAAMPGLEATLGSNHPTIVHALEILAHVEYERGAMAPAISLQREAVRRFRSLRPRGGASLSSVLYNLANLECQGGELDAASRSLAASREAWRVQGDAVAAAEFDHLGPIEHRTRRRSAGGVRALLVTTSCSEVPVLTRRNGGSRGIAAVAIA